MSEEARVCDKCDTQVTLSEAPTCGTMGDLDPDRWQTLCCPSCGARLETVFVPETEG